jgi:hypothetical protein
VRLAGWISGIAIVGLLGYCAKQQVAESEARADADAIVVALQRHKERNGTYPARLEDVGFKAQDLRDKWSLSYRMHDGKPALFYSAQNLPLVAHHYDFEARKWTSSD